jgi:RNA polymerase sigma-70 factor, ECF subfamily
VVTAITQLPQSQRAVICLRDICGLASDEACERLGISDVALRIRLHRARQRVRAAIFDDEQQ